MSAHPAMEPFLTPEQAAEILGVSVDWVYRKASGGEIPSYKLGGKRRLRASDLEEWAAGQRSGRMGTVTSIKERRR